MKGYEKLEYELQKSIDWLNKVAKSAASKKYPVTKPKNKKAILAVLTDAVGSVASALEGEQVTTHGFELPETENTEDTN